MKPYRFSPIKTKKELFDAITYTHFACYKLCKHSFGRYLKNAGNIGIFCHYAEEHTVLTSIRKELTIQSNNPDQKYFLLSNPIIIPPHEDVPETMYTHLYIRKPDNNKSQVGDVDFFLSVEDYKKIKLSLLKGDNIKGARIFERPDLDMIELYDNNIDALAYVYSTETEQHKP